MSDPEVSLLVLAHDTPREVEALLDSVVRHTHESYELLLIDNGSSRAGREAHEALSETYGARLIALDANLTFSIANNLGLRVSSGQEVVFLNSDIEVTHDWLRNLRAALHSAPDVGMVGPRTTFSHASQGGVWLDDDTPTGVDQFGRFFNHPDPTRWFESDWLAGFALLARRSALDAVDGFDETLPWHGLEDRALSEAMRAAGWRALVAGDTFVYHSGHRTFEAAGINRSATRSTRPAAPLSTSPRFGGRLIKDAQALVYEVRAGVAYHLEIMPGLIRDERRIEDAAPGELERLLSGPPVSACRVRGTDEVWVLHGGARRRVRGDHQRIRRLPWVWQVAPGELNRLPEGPAVRVEKALPPVAEMLPQLPSNPARIEAERLVTADAIAAEIRAAIDAGQGYSLIRLDADAVLVLNDGMWPAGPLDRARAGVRDDIRGAGLALREAIIGADCVGVLEEHMQPVGAPLLEQLLFHYDLYPRQRCSSQVGFALMGLVEGVGGGARSAPLRELLEGRRIAIVCARALTTENGRRRNRAHQHSQGYDVRIAAGLDDMRDLDTVFQILSERRSAFDVVLVSGAVPAKPLCTRLARELDVVALDLGSALDGLVHPVHRAGEPLVTLRGEVEAYLERAQLPPPARRHDLEGQLVRARDKPAIYYVERGAARELLHASLLKLFDRRPIEVPQSVIDALPLGTPVCAVHEPLSATYALIDGHKVPLDLGLPVVAVDDLALEPLALGLRPAESERRL